MNCISCQEPISEKFQYALSQNACPFCGKGIISEEDHYFRASLEKILKLHGLQAETSINAIVTDVVKLLSTPYPPEEEVIPAFEGGEEPYTLDGQIITPTPVLISGDTTERVVLPKPLNKRPPKKLGFKADGNDPISNRNFVPPSESMDMADIEGEIGGPTPEEMAEIQSEIDRGEIVFSSLK